MDVATFNASTGWAGKRITHDGERLLLEDHGAVTAEAVLTYDRQGQLDWAYDGLREWLQEVLTYERRAATARLADVAASTARGRARPRTPRIAVVGLVLACIGAFLLPAGVEGVSASPPYDTPVPWEAWVLSVVVFLPLPLGYVLSIVGYRKAVREGLDTFPAVIDMVLPAVILLLNVARIVLNL